MPPDEWIGAGSARIIPRRELPIWRSAAEKRLLLFSFAAAQDPKPVVRSAFPRPQYRPLVHLEYRPLRASADRMLSRFVQTRLSALGALTHRR
jgi:hypothetical protein